MSRSIVMEVRPYPSKPKTPFALDVRVDGKRRRLFFATKTAANEQLLKIKTKQRREGENALSISDDLRIAAATIQEQLKPFGKTLRDAGAFYLKHLQDCNRSITIESL